MVRKAGTAVFRRNGHEPPVRTRAMRIADMRAPRFRASVRHGGVRSVNFLKMHLVIDLPRGRPFGEAEGSGEDFRKKFPDCGGVHRISLRESKFPGSPVLNAIFMGKLRGKMYRAGPCRGRFPHQTP